MRLPPMPASVAWMYNFWGGLISPPSFGKVVLARMTSTRTSYMRPLAALVALVAAMAALGLALTSSPAHAAGSCSTTADTTTCTFDTSGTSTWTVPAGVTQATFDVFGAQGGSESFALDAGGRGG